MHDTSPQGVSRILVVDDDADAREALIDILSISGYSATPAGNGREAMDYLKTAAAPELIILDLQMPVMDGREFRAAQKRDPRLAAVPVVVVTALAGEKVDADETLIKPIDVDRLLRIVSHYVTPERAA